jgi:hypothetical protein
MRLNFTRLASPKRLVPVQSWRWNVYQQISAATVEFLEWCELSGSEYSCY